MNFNYAVSLTGSIATGKSTLSCELKNLGFEIIDMDGIAHEILDLHVEKIAKLFGDEFVKDGKVDRKSLGKLIFGNKKQKKMLEDLTHPLIKKELEKQAEILEQKKEIYFIENPLFFETNLQKCKYSVLVYAPKPLQLERLMKRSDLNEDEALKRINSQMDIEKKKNLASYVVDNSLDLEHLKAQLPKLQKWIKERYESIKI